MMNSTMLGCFSQMVGESEPRGGKKAGRLAGNEDTSSALEKYASIAQGFISFCSFLPSCGVAGTQAPWTSGQMGDKQLNGKNASKGDMGVIICKTWTQSLQIHSSILCTGTPTLPFYLPYTSNSHSVLSAIKKLGTKLCLAY